MNFPFLPKKYELTSYTPKYFKPYEFVDRETYRIRGARSLQLIDVRLLWTMDAIKEYFGVEFSVTINDWYWGGKREWSGLRTYGSPYYSPYSQHSFGRAIDFLISGHNANYIRLCIKKDPNNPAFKYITAIEDFEGMTWIHIDVRTWNKKRNGLLIFDR
jgi:hypothetical protein